MEALRMPHQEITGVHESPVTTDNCGVFYALFLTFVEESIPLEYLCADIDTCTL